MARTPSPDDEMIDLTPDSGPVDFSNSEVDLDNLKLNFSSEELASEARSFEAIPTGAYPAFIVQCDVKTSTSDKHYGKPYYSLRLKISDGKFKDRLLFSNVMLFDGALFTYTQLAKALDHNPTAALLKPADLVGKQVTVMAVKKIDKYKIEHGEWDEASGDPKPMKTEVNGFKKHALSGVGGLSDPLMP